jgi:MFS transporter, UMF1 family
MMDASETTVRAPQAASPLGQFAWALFDGARTPYNVLVNIFIFSAYFTTVVIADSVRGQVLWSYTSSIGALLVAVGAPILGAIADAGGRRKPWLVGCIVIGVPCMLALWYATPAMTAGLGWILAAIVGGTLFFEYSAIFCNAMLPIVAPTARIGFLSGLGLALGNVSGVILFLFFLFAWSWNSHPLFGLSLELHEPERAVGILAAIWLTVFGLPLFFLTPDSPATSGSKVQAVRNGIRNLAATIAKIGDYRNVVIFLIARMIFNEGFLVLMIFTGVFAAGILHWSATMLIMQGLINSVAAALAGFFAGWFDQRVGSKKSAMFFVAGCLIANVVVCSVTTHSVFFIELAQPIASSGGLFPTLPDKVFMVGEVAVAVFVTGGLVSSRALMAKISPPAMLNEFFGLYAMSGTATSFFGPLAVGIVTSLFNSQRAGIATGIAFLLAGLLLIPRVQEKRGPG